MIQRYSEMNEHPDPKTFLYIYRLMAVYSLVKPPNGSNVDGGDILTCLIDEEYDENNEDNKPPINKQKWQFLKDRIDYCGISDSCDATIINNTGLYFYF